MKNQFFLQALGLMMWVLVSCSPEKKEGLSGEPDVFEITEADLEFHIREGLTREQARAVLEKKMRGMKAALKSGIDRDPVVRARIANLLINRHRETVLQPKIKAALTSVTEERLRELYDQNITKFRQAERRQVAVLWLDPGSDPARKVSYIEKLEKARNWLLENEELTAKPETGFSFLSIDHSQHTASKYKGGVIGWIQNGASSSWTKAVSEIAFETDDLSSVIDRPEGLFLVRVMKKEAPRIQSFEMVRKRLRNQETSRLRKAIEAEFEENLR